MSVQANHETPYAALERLFHEPNRLGILSILCGAQHGLAFNELKDELRLTDGNLSRHLKALEDAEIVVIDKRFEGVRPRTTVRVTSAGRRQFLDYLKALEDVLERATRSAGVSKKEAGFFPGLNKAREA